MVGTDLLPPLGAMDRRRTINEYYRCYRDRDLEALRAMRTPGFRHVSSFAVYADRDRMLEEIWPWVGHSWARNVTVFGDGDEDMVKYEAESPDRPPMSMAERLRFEGDKIAEIEVFVGRQLEQ